MKIDSVSVKGIPSRAPLEVVKLATIESGNKAQGEGELFKAIASTAGGSFAADKAWAGFHASQTLTLQQVQDGLIANGLAPAHAPRFADAAYSIIKSEPTRVLLVAIAVLEATKKFNVPWRAWKRDRVVLAGVVVAVLAACVYILLRKLGLMN